MKTFAFKAEAQLPFSTAYNIAMNELENKEDNYVRIEGFSAIKVDGLWVMTIKYL